MIFNCPFDNTIHNSFEELAKHLKKFKIKQSDFFEEYYPRSDLLTGEPIKFKSFEQYFSARFKDKINMNKWFKENPEKSFEIASAMLSDRIEKKNLTIAPCEVELVSSGLPSIAFFQGKGDYGKICENFGATCLYDYSLDKLLFKNEKLDIIIDTRETKPFKFINHNTIDKKLEYGDYAIAGKENKTVIERKSLSDLIGSFVSGYDRVDREFQRAKDDNAYLIVVCEESLNTAMNFNYIPYIKRYTKLRPEVLFHNIRELIQKYNFQFVFCDGVKKATEITEKIFLYDGDITELDIQYMIDKKKLF
jgi:hypothetical protein